MEIMRPCRVLRLDPGQRLDVEDINGRLVALRELKGRLEQITHNLDGSQTP